MSIKKKTVAIVVNNNGENDTRIIKYAETLSNNYNVIVLCRNSDSGIDIKDKKGIRFVHIPYIKNQTMLIKAVIKHFLKYPTLIFRFSLLIQILAILASPFVVILGMSFLLLKFVSCLLRLIQIGINKFMGKYCKSIVISFEHLVTNYEHMKCIKPDLIHCHDLETITTSRNVAKALKVPFIYDAHELETDRNDRKGRINKLFIRSEESNNIKHSAAVITVSKGIAKIMSEEYKIALPEIIYNAPKCATHNSIKTIKQTLGLKKNQPLIVYVGLVTEDRCLDKLVESLCYLKNIHIALLGPHNLDSVTKLRKIANNLGVESYFHILPPVSPHNVLNFIRDADIGIALSDKLCLSYEYAMPNKFFEMILAGLPLIISDQSEMNAFIKDHHKGIILKSNAPQSIADAINTIMNNYEKYKSTETELAHLIKNYSWEAQENKILGLYEKTFSEELS